MVVMTAAQLNDARMLIPGAYELNAPPHRATQPERVAPAAPSQELRPHPATAATSYVVAAPARPTTRLGDAAAILGDVGLITAIIFAVPVGALLAVTAFKFAAALVQDALGRL
jgi:hypothetical protein